MGLRVMNIGHGRSFHKAGEPEDMQARNTRVTSVQVSFKHKPCYKCPLGWDWLWSGRIEVGHV